MVEVQPMNIHIRPPCLCGMCFVRENELTKIHCFKTIHGVCLSVCLSFGVRPHDFWPFVQKEKGKSEQFGNDD